MEKHQISCLLSTPNQGSGPQPRYVPWLGIEPVTFQFAGQHWIHWDTPARPHIVLISSIFLSSNIRFWHSDYISFWNELQLCHKCLHIGNFLWHEIICSLEVWIHSHINLSGPRSGTFIRNNFEWLYRFFLCYQIFYIFHLKSVLITYLIKI